MTKLPRRSIGITHKLAFLFLVLILVPFFVYTSITLHQSARNAEHAGRYSARQVLLQTGQFIESRVGLVRRSLDFISIDPAIRGISAGDPSTYDSNLTQWIIDANRFKGITLAMERSDPDITGVTFYMSRGLAAFSESREFKPLEVERAKSWYRAMLQRGEGPVWFPSHDFPSDGVPSVHAVARIPDDMDLARTAGYVRIDVPERVLTHILDQAQFSAASSAFLVDSSAELVALSARARGPDRPLVELAQARFSPTPVSDPTPVTLTVGDRKYLAECAYVKDTDWRLVLVVPYEDIDAFGKGVRRQMLLTLPIILTAMLPLAFWVASTSTRRIAHLIAGIRDFERGNLSVKVPEEGGDEIGELTRDFNRMVSRIAALLEEHYRLGQEMKHLEMTALQAQINPHFLYNTLDLVNCLSLKLGVPKIGAVVDALSRFYRLSLSGGAEMVTIEQELQHVATYVRIQNMRFEDGITLELDVPEELRGCAIPKIVLQPLVENAILHGIREKKGGRGTIRISGSRIGPVHGSSEEAIAIEIADDGVGMGPRRMEEMLRGEKPHEGHGYGVRNIDRRLKVQFGDRCGLSYRSARGGGTTVTVVIPAAGHRPVSRTG